MARLFCFYGLLVTAVIVHKKIDEWYIEWQRVVQRVTTTDSEWQPMYNERQRVTTNDNKWQRVTTNDNEWQRVVQRETTSDNKWQRVTMNDNEWQRVVQRETTRDNKWQRVITNDNEWQRVVTLANFPFFRIRKKPTTMHPKETF